jgi:hypothetical protein
MMSSAHLELALKDFTRRRAHALGADQEPIDAER